MFITFHNNRKLLEKYSRVYLDGIYVSPTIALINPGYYIETGAREFKSIFKYKNFIILNYLCRNYKKDYEEIHIHIMDLSKCF